MTSRDLEDAYARLSRLEEKVESQQVKIGEVAEDTAWIKGYLQTNGNSPKRRPVRDGALVAGGGGVVGTVLFILERIFGGGVVP